MLKNTDNVFIRFVVNAFSGAANQRLRQFSSVEEAMGFLRRIDPGISWYLAHPEVLELAETEPSR